MIRRFLKFILIAYLVLFVLSLFLSGCFSFRLSQKQLNKQFEGAAIKPVQHKIQSGDLLINYAEAGYDSLPVAFFVHGSPGSWSAFVDFMKDSLLLTQVKIVAVDRPGFGYTDFGNGVKSLEKQSEYLKPLVEKYRKNGNKMILIGHSLGGPLIARMAMDYPQLIDNLIIVAGSIDPELEPNEKWFRVPLNFPPIRILIPKSFRASNTEILHLKPELEKMVPLWANITQPVTVIHGGKDFLVDPENVDFARKMLTQAKTEFVVVDSMSHFVPWTHPQLIKNAIRKSLKP